MPSLLSKQRGSGDGHDVHPQSSDGGQALCKCDPLNDRQAAELVGDGSG